MQAYSSRALELDRDSDSTETMVGRAVVYMKQAHATLSCSGNTSISLFGFTIFCLANFHAFVLQKRDLAPTAIDGRCNYIADAHQDVTAMAPAPKGMRRVQRETDDKRH